MARKSRVYYIAPSAIGITPNANSSASDLAVYVAPGAMIRVFSGKIDALAMRDNTWQQWSFSGRNRRLLQPSKPYTVYARLRKVTDYADKDSVKAATADGYLVFSAKVDRNEGVEGAEPDWHDRYNYVTDETESGMTNIDGARTDDYYWYFRMGDVSVAVGGKRTVTFDTGVLGTDEYNMEWEENPDDLPLRVEIGCTDPDTDEDAGPTPYVRLDKRLVMTAALKRGWGESTEGLVRRWLISRNTGNAELDEAWNLAHAEAFAQTGSVTLDHTRNIAGDDLAGAVAAVFAITAMGDGEPSPTPEPEPEDQESQENTEDTENTENSEISETSENPEDQGNTGTTEGTQGGTGGQTGLLVPLASASITVLAETSETYQLILSASTVSYYEGTYIPADGVTMRVRCSSQGGETYDLTYGQFSTLAMALEYQVAGTDTWVPIAVGGAAEDTVTAAVDAAVFGQHRDVTIRLTRSVETAAGQLMMELTRSTVTFTESTADSKDREWIFLRSRSSITFGDVTSVYPEPGVIRYGEVSPEGAAGAVTDDKDQVGWVPEGWYDEERGADSNYYYEYASYRDYVHEGEGGHWGDFVKAFVWHHFTGAMTEEEVIEVIDDHGSSEFLSKVIDDIAHGHITLEKGLTSLITAFFGRFGRTPAHGGTAEVDNGAAVYADGTGDFVNLIVRGLVRGSLTVEELVDARDMIFRRTLKSKDARKGFTDGHGIYMDALEGLIETDGLNVRGFMRVMELIVNRLQLMESDYSFTEGDTVEHVDYEDQGQTLVLTMHKDHDNDYTPFYPGDIIYGIHNDLLSRGAPTPEGHTRTENGSYFHTWMRVKSVDFNDNKVRVALYQGKYQSGTDPDTGEPEYTAVVPGGTNFSPYGTAIGADVTAPMLQEYNTLADPTDPESPTLGDVGFDTMLNVTRHGNVADGIDPETGQYDAHVYQSQLGRQQAWVLSTTDKRLSFFWHVDQPIIKDEFYALCLGMLPDLANLPTTRDRTMPSLYINTLFADNIEQANYPARVLKTDRGAWTASPAGTYEGDEGGTWTPDGTTTVPGDVDEHGQLRVYDQHTRYGQTGVPQTVQPGAAISEPYHYRTFTKADWLYKRLSPAWAGLTDAALERQMLRQAPKADLETSRVWKGGKLWECLQDGTSQQPGLGTTHWLLVGGDTVWWIEFESSNGSSFYQGHVSTVVTARLYWGQEEVTQEVAASAFVWTRSSESGKTDADRAWDAMQGHQGAKQIQLTDADMPVAWSRSNKAIFTLTVTVPDGTQVAASITA